MTVKELIVQLLDTPLDKEVHVEVLDEHDVEQYHRVVDIMKGSKWVDLICEYVG